MPAPFHTSPRAPPQKFNCSAHTRRVEDERHKQLSLPTQTLWSVSPHRTSPTASAPADPAPPGVLGATGSVGQRFILLLAIHPHFKLTAVGASSRSAGKKYKDAARWKQSLPMSKELGELVVKECRPEEFKDEVDIVFSGLDSDVAGETGTCESRVDRTESKKKETFGVN